MIMTLPGHCAGRLAGVPVPDNTDPDIAIGGAPVKVLLITAAEMHEI